MTERITEDVHVEASTPHRDTRNGPSCFFTPVENSVFTTKTLTTKARQILLILELKAGTSRIAKISQREIAALTGYPLRTVERSLHSLREQEWITQADAGVLQLEKPTPGRCYVPVYESVVHHPDWEDWQKHLLLFVMSQFRGRDQEFGVSLYSLNLRGSKGMSIDRSCRIPGSTTQRRRIAREFVEQLEDEGILRVVEDATSNRPAICTVDRNMLENIQPDFERHQSARCRVTGPPKNLHRHASPSNTVTPHRPHRHPSPSNTVTRHLRKRSQRFRRLQEDS